MASLAEQREKINDVPASIAAELTDAEWSSLPSDSKACVARLCSKLHAQRQEMAALRADTDELRDIACAAWASRWKPAVAFKVAILQRLHKRVLKSLRAAWDDRRFQPDGAAQPASIHSLDSALLECVLELLPGHDTRWTDLSNQIRPPRRELKCDSPWHVRRGLAQVCRLFEVLTYETTDSAHLHVGDLHVSVLPASAPPGFAVRELERAALSSRLKGLDVFLPASLAAVPPGILDIATVAEVLPQCAALEQLCLYIDASGLGQLSADLTAALPRCTRLQLLTLEAYDREHDAPRVKFDRASTAQFCSSLSQLTHLTELQFGGVKLSGANELFSAVSVLPLLRQLDFTDVKSSSGWMPFLMLSTLTAISIYWCPDWAGGSGDANHVPHGSKLEHLYVDTAMSEHDQVQLAALLPALTRLSALALGCLNATSAGISAFKEALPQMRELRHVELRPFGAEGGARDLFPALPLCLKLTKLAFACAEDPVSEGWVEALAEALPACLTLSLFGLAFAVLPDNAPDALLPLCRALPLCPKLAKIEMVEVALGLRAMCALCADMCNSPSITSVEVRESGLDELAKHLARKLAESAPRVTFVLDPENST